MFICLLVMLNKARISRRVPRALNQGLWGPVSDLNLWISARKFMFKLNPFDCLLLLSNWQFSA